MLSIANTRITCAYPRVGIKEAHMLKTATMSSGFQEPTAEAALVSSPKQQREEQLIHRAQHNDLDAFTELVDEYQNAVYRQAYWLLGEPEAAEDAAQEAFYRAYRKIHTFNGPSFRAWIMSITTNYCLDQLRRCRTHPSIPLTGYCDSTGGLSENSRWLRDPQPTPEQVVERAELRSGIHKCLLGLPAKYRLPIILVDIQEMAYQDAAQVLGMRLGSFKSRLSRGRAQLMQATLRMLNANPHYS